MRCISFAIFALTALAFVPFASVSARAVQDDKPIRVRLNAEQIEALTLDQTWTIKSNLDGQVSETYFRPDGVRFTRSYGVVEKLNWTIRPQGQRCVHFDNRTRCGLIANIDGQLTICMQLAPMGDCNYSVVGRRNGDQLNLAQLYLAQNPAS